MSQLIVLTCASGKQCSQIIPWLRKDSTNYQLRLVVHSLRSLERLKTGHPEAEVIQADLGIPSDCTRIVDGATTVYYVGPTFQTHEAQFGKNIIDAAVAEAAKPASRLGHFIFSSVLHPEISKLLNHDRKRIVEEYLCESTLRYTILQPSHFVDNTIHRLLDQKDSPNPVFIAAHTPDIYFSFSCIKDHAEVSAKVIREGPKHYYATYQLVSTWPMKYTEYVKSIADEMGITIEIRNSRFEDVIDRYCELVFGDDQAVNQDMRDGPERLLLYYNKRGIIGNPAVLEWLLGRPATAPAKLARQILDSRGQASALPTRGLN